ncbi:twin transmembrane helix small protein [Pelagibius sp.]|uniref:twin transmembrane helix small protein n=1 Tax=Pelagibius sp. TaxID=1931238 RepID=UPI003BB029C6
MKTFFFVALLIAMLVTLGVLAVGMIGMAKGGDFNDKYGNKLMRARVISQGVTLVIFALAVLVGLQD